MNTSLKERYATPDLSELLQYLRDSRDKIHANSQSAQEFTVAQKSVISASDQLMLSNQFVMLDALSGLISYLLLKEQTTSGGSFPTHSGSQCSTQVSSFTNLDKLHEQLNLVLNAATPRSCGNYPEWPGTWAIAWTVVAFLKEQGYVK